MKTLLTLMLALCAVACDKEPEKAAEAAPAKSGPVYDKAFIEDLRIRRAGEEGGLTVAKKYGTKEEAREIEKEIDKLTRRIKHAEKHLGESYVHVEEP